MKYVGPDEYPLGGGTFEYALMQSYGENQGGVTPGGGIRNTYDSHWFFCSWKDEMPSFLAKEKFRRKNPMAQIGNFVFLIGVSLFVAFLAY